MSYGLSSKMMRCERLGLSLWLALQIALVSWTYIINQRITHHVISGVPFRIYLPENATIKSGLPDCISLKTNTVNQTIGISERRPRLDGFCFTPHAGLTGACDYRFSKSYYMNFLTQSPNNELLNLTLQVNVLPSSVVWNQREGEDFDRPKTIAHICHKRPPTVVILYFRFDICTSYFVNLSGMWDILRRYTLPEFYEDEFQPETDAIWLPDAYFNYGFHLTEDTNEILNNLQILATAQPHRFQQGEPSNNTTRTLLAAVWRVGCGSIGSRELEPLAALEEKFKNGSISIEMIDSSHKKAQLWITKWVVGDLVFPKTVTFAPSSPLFHQSRATNSRKSRSTADTHPALSYGLSPSLASDEGSGMFPSFSNPDFKLTSPYSHERKQPLLQPISPVNVTVHQITNVQIPTTTFSKVISPHDLELSLYLSTGKNLTAEQLRSAKLTDEQLGQPISRDSKDWISFDPRSRIVRLRPLPKQVGEHRIVLCAETKSRLRACEMFLLTVRRPPPFRKNFILRVPPGIFWCYNIPIYWFEELKVHSFKSLELKVTGDAPFSWNPQIAEVCVVTVLKNEQIITLFLLASNNDIAQSVEVEFRLSAKVPKSDRLLTVSRLRLKLQWSDSSKPYHLQELMRVNASLAQVLRVHVNPEVSAQRLYIYDIIHFLPPTTQTYPAVLELDFIFLPYGVPTENEDAWGTSNDDVKFVKRPYDYLTEKSTSGIVVTELMRKCKESSLDGAEAAIKATAESFKPFTVVLVKLTELETSLCQKVKQSAHTLQTGYIFNPMGNQSADWQAGIRPPVNVQIMVEVVSNFTVAAGVSFKKSIHPDKATPVKRIQYIELITMDGKKLDDSAWLGLTTDNGQLFGLPLVQNIRKQPYAFCLNIYSVDLKTPISVAFTIEVQNWFVTGMHMPPGQSNPNHRVRLRILPTLSKRSWTNSPIQSLDYRWHLSKAIDRFLRPNCSPPCNPDVGIWEINNLDNHAILVIWAQLSILSDVGKSYPSTDFSSAECPWEKVNRLQNALTFAPSVISAERNRGLVTGYTENRELFLAPWAAPSTVFRDHLESMGLGKVEAAVVDRMGPCARVRSEEKSDNSSINEDGLSNVLGISSANDHEQKFTIYTGEGFRHSLSEVSHYKSSQQLELHLYDMMGQKIGSSNWIGLEKDQTTVFGIVMGNAVQPTRYRFKIGISADDVNGVPFSVFVAGSNPHLPDVYNHRVITRFGPDRGAQQWTGGHSLLDRWRLVVSLDTFLRPQCVDNTLCQNNMDVLLLTFNYQAHGFTVIWAQKTLLMQTSAMAEEAAQFDSYEQQQHWDKWMQKKHSWSTSRLRRHDNTISDPAGIIGKKRSGRYLSPGCPERSIVQLERKLVGDSGHGFLPHPEFAQHLKYAGVGQVNEVHVERLGPCVKTAGNTPLIIPEPPVMTNSDLSPWDAYRYTTPVETYAASDFVDKSSRQRILLLSILVPGCLLIIAILIGILAFVCHRKRSSPANDKYTGSDLQNASRTTEHEDKRIAICGSLFKRKTAISLTKNETEFMLSGQKQEDGVHNNIQKLKVTGQHVNGGHENGSSAPTRPLILHNERPPLKPSEYNLGYIESPINSVTGFNQTQSQFRGSFAAAPNDQISGSSQPKIFYGGRPNPYRNLPPPIDVRPGSMIPPSQIYYAPYQKAPTP